MQAEQETPYRDTKAAAAYLCLSPAYLDLLRVKGGGPAYRKFGRRVVYHLRDLEAWAESRQTLNTSQRFRMA